MNIKEHHALFCASTLLCTLLTLTDPTSMTRWCWYYQLTPMHQVLTFIDPNSCTQIWLCDAILLICMNSCRKFLIIRLSMVFVPISLVNWQWKQIELCHMEFECKYYSRWTSARGTVGLVGRHNNTETSFSDPLTLCWLLHPSDARKNHDTTADFHLDTS